VTEAMCMASAKGLVNCWLPENHEGDHFDKVCGICWYKREGSGVREPRLSLVPAGSAAA
jgi:hypothetical protein